MGVDTKREITLEDLINYNLEQLKEWLESGGDVTTVRDKYGVIIGQE